MEQLISQLENRVSQLLEELDRANEQIQQLTRQDSTPSTDYSASMDLLQHMADRSTEEQLQLYIEDSLDLLTPEPAISKQASKPYPVETQLSFNLLPECADSSAKATIDKQTIDMTKPQTEMNELPEVKEEATATAEETLPTQEASAEGSSDALTGENSPAATPELSAEQKRRQKNQKNNRRLIKMLEDRYPKAFDWNQPKPLKVGIDKDMVLDDDFNASKQKRALAAYTRSDRYKKCLLSGQPRIDLEGQPVNNEPALPEAMLPKKNKATVNRPKTDRNQPARPRNKPQAKQQNKPKHKSTPQKQEDDTYSNLSAEERMKAKLEKLLKK